MRNASSLDRSPLSASSPQLIAPILALLPPCALHRPYLSTPCSPTQEPVFRNDDIYFLSRSERYRRSLEKQRRLVEIQKDLSLANGDKQLLRTCVHDDVSAKGNQGSKLDT